MDQTHPKYFLNLFCKTTSTFFSSSIYFLNGEKKRPCYSSLVVKSIHSLNKIISIPFQLALWWEEGKIQLILPEFQTSLKTTYDKQRWCGSETQTKDVFGSCSITRGQSTGRQGNFWGSSLFAHLFGASGWWRFSPSPQAEDALNPSGLRGTQKFILMLDPATSVSCGGKKKAIFRARRTILLEFW